MEKVALVMVVSPVMGHLTQALELAKLMLQRNNQLSITALIMKMSIDPEGTTKIQSLIASTNIERLDYQDLPTPEDTSDWNHTLWQGFLLQLIDYQKIHVRRIASKINHLSGFLLDLSCMAMVDVAEELGVPAYLFFTSSAAFLGLVLHFQSLEDEDQKEIPELVKAGMDFTVPCFANPVPITVLPKLAIIKEYWSSGFLLLVRAYRRTKGIIVNTFADLETYAIQSFSIKSSSYGNSGLPPIYPVGPILSRSQIKTQSTNDNSELMNWLDCQPENSVVFLCFGSSGAFQSDQVHEIAYGIEQSGYRFIWVLRQPPANIGGFAREYENHEHVLPDGFLNRTASTGKVVGWVPQLDILSHPAVGGFVSHCGWNSVLESIVCGVPTWPLYAEQQLNAFQLVKELGIAVEISLDYGQSNPDEALVRAERIEKGIQELMDVDNKLRKRIKEFSEKSRLAMEKGGSSHLALDNFMEYICSNHHQVSKDEKICGFFL